MTSPRDIKARLISIAEPVCAASGYELVDLDYESGNGGWVIRIYIDHAPGHVGGLAGGISFADCEVIARELGAVLDVEDPVPHAYRLEVSSPGVDRPLRRADHFRRQLGHMARIELAHGLDGRRNFKGVLAAVIEAEGAAPLIAIEVDGVRFELPITDVERARLVPDWDALLKGQGQGPRSPERKKMAKPKAARARAQD